jgi:hypothetical protein
MDPRIQNTLGITLTAFVLVLTLSAAGTFFIANGAYKSSEANNINVSSEAEVAATPDVAKFTFSIVTEGGKDVAEVQKENASKSNAVVDSLIALGIEKEDIKTAYSVDPRYQYFQCKDDGECPPRETVGYTATQTVTVKSRNFEKVGEVLNAAVESGANEISQLSYSIEDPTEVQNQAREIAIEKAKEKAESLAKAGDFKLGKLVAISDSEYGTNERMEYSMMDSAVSTKAEGFVPTQPGTQDVKVSVTLTYRIK